MVHVAPATDSGGSEDTARKTRRGLRLRRLRNRKPISKASDGIPVVVSRYLLPREATVIVVRRHSGVLLVPMADAVGAVAIALALTGTLADSSSLKLVI